MEKDGARIVDLAEVVPVDVDDELVNEVEVVTDDSAPAASEDIPHPPASTTEKATSTSSVATSTQLDYQNQLVLLVMEVTALKERLIDLMKRVHERLMQEALVPDVVPNEPAALEIVNTPPVATGDSHPLSDNSAVKRKSPKSKYAKKRRALIPGGVTRVPRSLNDKPSTTTVGKVNLATEAYEIDDDFD